MPDTGKSLSWRDRLIRCLSGKVIVLGIGSPFKGDDAAGLLCAERIRELKVPGVEVFLAGSAPENFVGKFRRMAARGIIAIDAGDFGAEPGSIWLGSPQALEDRDFSTHGLPLSKTLSLLEAESGAECIILLMQPARLGFGEPLSPEVERALNEVVEVFRRAALRARRGTPGGQE